MGTSQIGDPDPSRSRPDEETVDKSVGRIAGCFLRSSDGQLRLEVGAVPDGPFDLPGRGG
jgi:hypothetical protein